MFNVYTVWLFDDDALKSRMNDTIFLSVRLFIIILEKRKVIEKTHMQKEKAVQWFV